MSKNNPESHRNHSRMLYTPEPKDKHVPKSACANLSMSFSHRATMASSDFLPPQSLSRKKKNPVSRQSIMPSQLALGSIKEAEEKSKDEELKLLYNDYLQTIMLEHLTKKKSEEMKNTIIEQLTTIFKQCAQDEEKLLKLKIRKRDIMNLSAIQQELDIQINDLNECFGNNKINTAKDIMSHLCSVLEPLDQLQCNNVILPENPEEWLKLREALKECESVLGRIKELINTKAETYQVVHDGLQDFVTVYNDMQSHQQKLDKALYNLQVLTLKYGAFFVK